MFVCCLLIIVSNSNLFESQEIPHLTRLIRPLSLLSFLECKFLVMSAARYCLGLWCLLLALTVKMSHVWNANGIFLMLILAAYFVLAERRQFLSRPGLSTYSWQGRLLPMMWTRRVIKHSVNVAWSLSGGLGFIAQENGDCSLSCHFPSAFLVC